jgi:hypothetical protein
MLWGWNGYQWDGRWERSWIVICCSPASQLSLTLTHLNLLNIVNKAALQILFKLRLRFDNLLFFFWGCWCWCWWLKRRWSKVYPLRDKNPENIWHPTTPGIVLVGLQRIPLEDAWQVSKAFKHSFRGNTTEDLQISPDPCIHQASSVNPLGPLPHLRGTGFHYGGGSGA